MYAAWSEGDGRPASAVHERSPESPTPRVRLHLKPGQKGTKQLLAQYGDRLICVRYRYDPARKKRFKTVELVVAERDWKPPRQRFPDDHVVGLRVAFAEVEVRDRVKQAGGMESGATDLAVALRSRCRTRPEEPRRHRIGIQ